MFVKCSIRRDERKATLSVMHEDRSTHTIALPFLYESDPFTLERIRWYFEDYPAVATFGSQSLAEDADRRMAALGHDLYRALFGHTDARDLDDILAARPGSVHLQIASADEAVDQLPWELMRRSRGDRPIAVAAASFTRTVDAGQPPTPSATEPLAAAGRELRVLWVTARPGGRRDVPYRSIVRPVVEAMSTLRGTVAVQIARPPTFARLSQVLQQSHKDGAPFDLVHFDGHGVLDSAGGQPFLLFEADGNADTSSHRVSGEELGSLLTTTGVRALVMNACRSGGHVSVAGSSSSRALPVAFGSLASRALGAGLQAVVAMKYNVYVPTAAAFMSSFYENLAGGGAVHHAAQCGRRFIFGHSPGARTAPGWSPWAIPVVYSGHGTITAGSRSASECLDPPTEREPLGNHPVGLDGPFLSIQRTLESAGAVVVHGLAGAGKTLVAQEVSRWRSATEGLPRRLEGTSLGPGTTAQSLYPALLGDTTEATASPLDHMRSRALHGLRGQDVDWVIDGFERMLRRDGTLTAAGQELLHLIREARRTGTNIAITSRADIASLDPSFVRVHMTNMSLDECLDMASRFAAVDATVYAPIVNFANGNPFTLRALLQRADELELRTAADTQSLVHAAAVLASDETFTDLIGPHLATAARELFVDLRDQLTSDEQLDAVAALCMYRNAVSPLDLAAIWGIGGAHMPPRTHGLSPEGAREVLELCCRNGGATEARQNAFALHPCLPIAFRSLFIDRMGGSDQETAGVTAAYVEAIKGVATFYVTQAHLEGGTVPWHMMLGNLLASLNLALEHRWWERTASLVQVLAVAETTVGSSLWRGDFERATRRVLDELDQAEDAILPPGLLDIAADLAERSGDLGKSMQLRTRAHHLRRGGGLSSAERPSADANVDTDARRSLAVSLNKLGEHNLKQSMGHQTLELLEALKIARSLDDWWLQAAILMNLGIAGQRRYESLCENHPSRADDVSDLVEAEGYLSDGVSLVEGKDSSLKAHLLSELAAAQLARLERTLPEERADQLNDVCALLDHCLDLLGEGRLAARSAALMHLGRAHLLQDRYEEGRRCLEKAIQLRDLTGDALTSSDVRLQVAKVMATTPFCSEAKKYAADASDQASKMPSGELIARAAYELYQQLDAAERS